MFFHYTIIPFPTTVDSSILILNKTLEYNSIPTTSAVLHLASTLYVSVFYSEDYSFDDELSLIYRSEVEATFYLTEACQLSKEDNLCDIVFNYIYDIVHESTGLVCNALCLYKSS